MKPGPELDSEIQAGQISPAQTMGPVGSSGLLKSKPGRTRRITGACKSGAGNPYSVDESNARFLVAFKTLPSRDFTSQAGGDLAKGCGKVKGEADLI